ncbi:MAG: TIGR02281 family clan AA aspartic protease [Alphaproteobacteria bacterium]|nr:TIGR02281 family clan AA aspartic protease [Alphaproteobacteria bacterium]
MGEILSWAVVAVVLAYAMANFESVKGFTATLLGIELPQDGEAAATVKSANALSQAPNSRPLGYVELAADGSGHYRADLEINGRSVGAMVDTGATVVAMSHEDARRAGIVLSSNDYTHRVRTANGIAKVAPVTLSRVRLGDITVRNVEGVVTEQGAMDGTLLGMSFLSRLSRFEIRDGRLILQE